MDHQEFQGFLKWRVSGTLLKWLFWGWVFPYPYSEHIGEDEPSILGTTSMFGEWHSIGNSGGEYEIHSVITNSESEETSENQGGLALGGS